mmetsp:Transcript_16071/g.24964  ORF Transcript_16071/g.24964 Transcript_16071/m.24964 type:complete len:103 (-) Transcript_16071:19-327(-)
MEQLIQTKVTQAIPALHHFAIRNKSHLHSHHVEIAEEHPNRTVGESHFAVVVVSDHFEGMAPVERHQEVTNALREEMIEKGTIYSLEVKAKTVAQWNKMNEK